MQSSILGELSFNVYHARGLCFMVMGVVSRPGCLGLNKDSVISQTDAAHVSLVFVPEQQLESSLERFEEHWELNPGDGAFTDQRWGWQKEKRKKDVFWPDTSSVTLFKNTSNAKWWKHKLINLDVKSIHYASITHMHSNLSSECLKILISKIQSKLKYY